MRTSDSLWFWVVLALLVFAAAPAFWEFWKQLRHEDDWRDEV